MSDQFDILIQNSKIIDGTGSPGFISDLGIKDGRIRAVDRSLPTESAKRIIDGTGLVTAPGFIDTHTHDDFLVLIRPQAEEKVRQGVTSVVVGNCGVSGAPLGDNKDQYIKGMMGNFGGNHLDRSFWDVSTMSDYLQQVRNTGPGPNVAPLLGHSNLRFAVMGMENRPPTAAEMDKMKRMATEAMEAGAFGISTGLIYAPSIYAEMEELVELSAVAARHGGLYTTHMRSEGRAVIEAMEEALTIGRRADMPVHISHHKLTGRNNWGRSVETLALMDRARAGGLAVSCDQYPYEAGSTVLAALLPPAMLSDNSIFEKLQDPGFRATVTKELSRESSTTWENLALGTGFENIVISASSSHPELMGHSIAAIADENGKSAMDMFLELLADGFDTTIILFSMSDEDIERIMKSPHTMIGSDGIPGFGPNKTHPRMTGTFPKILGKYVREKGVLELEEAIHKMTQLPAETFGIKNRGKITPDFEADLVLFNPDTVSAMSSYDEPQKKPQGIPYVLVNGQLAIDAGNMSSATYGQVLTKQ
ncbi:MAG: D-aminoacylase [bacterium]